jgi:hypothetical protein
VIVNEKRGQNDLFFDLTTLSTIVATESTYFSRVKIISFIFRNYFPEEIIQIRYFVFNDIVNDVIVNPK